MPKIIDKLVKGIKKSDSAVNPYAVAYSMAKKKGYIKKGKSGKFQHTKKGKKQLKETLSFKRFLENKIT